MRQALTLVTGVLTNGRCGHRCTRGKKPREDGGRGSEARTSPSHSGWLAAPELEGWEGIREGIPTVWDTLVSDPRPQTRWGWVLRPGQQDSKAGLSL